MYVWSWYVCMCDTALLLLTEPIGSLEGCSLSPSPFQGHQKQPLGERACSCVCSLYASWQLKELSHFVAAFKQISHTTFKSCNKYQSFGHCATTISRQNESYLSHAYNAAPFWVSELLYQFRHFMPDGAFDVQIMALKGCIVSVHSWCTQLSNSMTQLRRYLVVLCLQECNRSPPFQTLLEGPKCPDTVLVQM